ncbi:MAG: vacuolar-type H+-ATPase subunit H [Oscillospiraceae bacterium]|nr:vacuolar-type H+-ATPase subunit H [Oscillospiraceae bacterium]
MSIDEILDDMDELLDKAAAVPFASHKSVIDGERLRELINDVRLNMPQEIKHAKMVEYDRERIIKEAEAKAERIVRQAEDRAKTLVAEDAIVREAKKRALEAVTKAKSESDAIKSATDTYVANRFQEVENYFNTSIKDIDTFFSTNLKDVQNRKAKFEQLKRKSGQKPAAAADEKK